MKYFVYKITHIPSGRFYIGRHSTEDLNDGYFGSGILVKRLLNKYPIGEFEKTIQLFCCDEESAAREETKLIEENFENPLNINISKSGFRGGREAAISKGRYLKEHFPEEYKDYIQMCNDSRKKNISKGRRVFLEKFTDNILFRNEFITKLKQNQKLGVEQAKNQKSRWKRKNTLNKIHHQKAEKNSNYGKTWMVNFDLKMSKPVEGSDIEKLKLDGWVLGRKIKFERT